MKHTTCPGSIAPALTRRGFLQQASAGFGMLALNGLFSREASAGTHFAAKAKNVIFCFMDAVTAIMAFSSAGMKDKADIIRREIFRRQHEGILPNGSGFYMGVVNIPGQCYSILKWDGTPTDYEGIISRDCSFLQTAILTDDPARELFQQAAAQKP